MPFELENRKTDQSGQTSNGYRCSRHGKPGINTVCGSQNPGNISAQAEEAGMPKRNLSGITEQQVECYCQHRVYTDKHQHVHYVATFEQLWSKHDQH